METLLRLAEAGHYETVRQLFNYPLKNCPDVLLLALLQTSVRNLHFFALLEMQIWHVDFISFLLHKICSYLKIQ